MENSGAAVRLFDARLDDGTRVLLKEFIGEACEIGENECATYELLYQPRGPWRKARSCPRAPSEIGRLLGSMRADSSFASDVFVAEWEAALPNIMPPSPNGFWLVFQWENLRTVSNFPDAEQGAAGLFDVAGKQAEQARRRFVKAAAAQRCLEVIAWLHGQGIAHRSLGGASLLLNTYDQRTPPKEVAVSVIDLGFATTAARIAPEEVGAAMQRGAKSPLDVIPFLCRADDLHALAYILLELILSSSVAAPAPAASGLVSLLQASDVFGGGGAAGGGDPRARAEPTPPDLQSLKRLVEDVFDGDVCEGFRGYCVEEPSWAGAVELLDEADGAGWRVVQALVDCRDASSERCQDVSAERLLESPWFAA